MNVDPIQRVDLVRLSTAGSVDDGKSTLIGRLLYESKAVFDDQLRAVERASRDQGLDFLNLALLTDGLRAERAQGITIDVAYRHLLTEQRRFIIADTPGHAEYTRNMITGASTADVAIILVDASRGISDQSRRHFTIASLLRVPHILICINKMDLVAYSSSVFDQIRASFGPLLAQSEATSVTFIPISALVGDNVTAWSLRMPWYHGPSVLEHLESVPISGSLTQVGPRFPVQWVIRLPNSTGPGSQAFAGQLSAGILKERDEVVVLPYGLKTRIASIEISGKPVSMAAPSMSLAVTLSSELDVSRGDMIVRADDQPIVACSLEATICWLGADPLRAQSRYLLKHTTRSTPAWVDRLLYKVPIPGMATGDGVEILSTNEIGRCIVCTSAPIVVDLYSRNRTTGAFILIDENSNETVGAGMIDRAT